MKNPFSIFFRARDKPKDAISAATTFSFGIAGSGKSVNARTAIQVSAVYACVRVIAETVASLPFSVFEQDKEGCEKALDHPLYRLLHDEPNPEMTSFVWREAMLTHLLLWGNSFSQILRAGRGSIVGLYPLLPDRMEVDRDDKGTLTYTYSTTNGQTVKLRPEDVLHIPGLGFDGIMGYSPIAVERNAVGLSIAAEEFGSKFFGNGARPSGILTHPNTVKNPKALRESWMEAYGGTSNANRVAILEEGMRFEPIAIPNNEAQFLETRKFQVEEICRIYRVPPHMMRGLVHVITTASGDRKIPLVTNYGNASWVEEENLIPETDVAFGQVSLGAHKLATAIRISQELLQDSAFDMASFITHEFQRRAGAAEEEAIISGDGSHKPIGLLHATLGAQVGVTTASSTAITADEMIDLQHSLKSGYRRKAAFIMNDAAIKALRKLKDGQGQYLWQPSIREGVPDMILNTRVYMSNYMPLVEAGNKVVLYGDYSYYWLADRAGRTLQRLNELYAMTDQVGFKLTERLDGRLILPEAVKVLQMKA